jgi:hypothetical protein
LYGHADGWLRHHAAAARKPAPAKISGFANGLAKVP